MAQVSLKDIKKVYNGKVTAVHSFSLDIEDKEFVVLVGPSGCGKTTTLRMIAGLEDITSGELSIDGKVVNDVAPKDRDIAMVFQNYALYPHMSVYENMAFGLKLRKLPESEIKEKVMEAARILEIEKLLERKPKELSGGQRQRVALGRAIVRNPKVFLMDEPLSNLDAKLRVQMRAEIAKLHHRLQTTFIYVTHDQTEAMTMGTRIVIMKDGFVQQVDTPQNTYKHPKNLFVASFIGSPEINIMKATIIEDGGRLKAKVDTGDVFFLPAEKEKTLRDGKYLNKQVYIGFRPEHVLEFSPEESTDEMSTFQAEVTVSEMMGAEVFLYFDFCGKQMISREKSSTKLKVGDKAKMRVKSKRMYIFDMETEEGIY